MDLTRIVPLLGAVLLATACGGSASGPRLASVSGGGSAAVTPSPTPSASLTELWAQLARCFRQHGANEPDPTVDDQGQPQFQVPPGSFPVSETQPCLPIYQQAVAAQQAQVQEARVAQKLAQNLKFAQCMRQHGDPTFPDPDPRTGVFDIKNPDDPAMRQAGTSCLSLFHP